jgi:hypothetical protein
MVPTKGLCEHEKRRVTAFFRVFFLRFFFFFYFFFFFILFFFFFFFFFFFSFFFSFFRFFVFSFFRFFVFSFFRFFFSLNSLVRLKKGLDYDPNILVCLNLQQKKKTNKKTRNLGMCKFRNVALRKQPPRRIQN